MLNFDPERYSYPSRRNVVYGRHGMACTSVPLGAQIGVDVMKAGGNAVDAAVAMAAAMPLLEPTGNALCGSRKTRSSMGSMPAAWPPWPSAPGKCGSWALSRCPRRGGFPPWCPGSGRLGPAQGPFRHKTPQRAVCPRHFLRPGGRSRPGERGQAVAQGYVAHCQGHGAKPCPPPLLVGALHQEWSEL